MGLMLAEPDFHTRCFVEWEEYPRQSIIAAQRAGYFTPAPIWDDVTTFDGQPFRGAIDTILAGYPCQPFSAAGQRRGADDERHLWPDVARVIREVDPEWVFLENVAGHVSLGLETVLRDLWDMGRTPAVGLFSAGETGAPHERLRVFIVAHRNSQQWGADGRQSDAGTDGRNDAGRGGGNAMADTSGAGSQGRERRGSSDQRHRSPAYGSTAERGRPRIFPPGPSDMAGWAEILADDPHLAPAISVGDVKRACDHFAALVEGGQLAEAEAQSLVCLAVDGLSNRSRALRLLGNGAVPLAAAYAWRTLANAHGLGALDLETHHRGTASGPDGADMRAAE